MDDVRKIIKVKKNVRQAKNSCSKRQEEQQQNVDSTETSRVIDPCFKNVLRKELENDRKLKHKSSVLLQGHDRLQDGINIDVETEDLEELDYVDDVVDEDLSDFEEGPATNSKESTLRLSGATMVNRSLAVEHDEQRSMQQSLDAPHSSAQIATGDLTNDELANLPRVQNLFNQFWAEKMRALQSEKTSGGRIVSVKSPSDTTIYAPAIIRSSPASHGDNCLTQQLDDQARVMRDTEQTDNSSSEPTKLVNDIISNFVDTVRIEQRQSELDLQDKERRKSSSDKEMVPGFDEARAKTDRTVLEAEKFRASIVTPNPGMLVQEVEGGPHPIPNIGGGMSDDDFFHLTCHIDPSLFHKIEMAEFVELEKLLLKDKLGGNRNEESHFEWVQRDGGTFLPI